MSYYEEKFKKLNKELQELQRYLNEKIDHAKHADADPNYIRELEAESYALKVIWVRTNESILYEPRK
ncbi:hypothetical protein [Mammaliicoccus sp. Dog046]|uniref:hypothetical protein n=1 Tax=Mammaliicoccus sp. Dog046 TaxID=3034233 RepID=UPI002B25ABBD|nr:hypothetical protein [Mammaliicoccus sp. Dog046]WQK85431.1 hypothetical protein P3U32_12620 [Mammaliicoccus sp. Dog046]